jgi:hypothetical protein
MDEQRILDEMERMLAADDPRLAARLASFSQPGLGHALRTRRGRLTLSLMLLALVAAVAIVLYMMSAFRLNGGTTGGPGRPGSAHSHGPAGARAASLPRAWRPARPGPVDLVNPACAATMAPRVCTTWALAAARHK